MDTRVLILKVLPKVAVATVILTLVTLSAELGNPLLAAVAATAPVTLPLSLYVVVQVAGEGGRAASLANPADRTETTAGAGAAAGASSIASASASATQQQEQVEKFLWLTCKGMVATLAWCVGALLASRNGMAGSFGALAFVGYASWAVVWKVLQSV